MFATVELNKDDNIVPVRKTYIAAHWANHYHFMNKYSTVRRTHTRGVKNDLPGRNCNARTILERSGCSFRNSQLMYLYIVADIFCEQPSV